MGFPQQTEETPGKDTSAVGRLALKPPLFVAVTASGYLWDLPMRAWMNMICL